MWWQSPCGCKHSGRNVANNMLFDDIRNGRPPIDMMLILFIQTPSLRVPVFISIPIKVHMFYHVYVVMRSSPNRHIRSRQMCHVFLCCAALGRCHKILIGPVLCACTHDIAVFIIFGGILAPLDSMRPSRMYLAMLG